MTCEHPAVVPERALSKPERQKLVLSLVERRSLGTQQELLEALEAEGCRVTQATVSRDIRELGLRKAANALGGERYVRPESERRVDPRETLRALLERFARRASAAGNIVVLHCDIGSAPGIARALDRAGHPHVVGSLAGDDTVLVIAPTARDAAALARELTQAAQAGG